MDTEELSRRHTGEDLQVDPASLDSETSSLYDDDEKQLVTPLTSRDKRELSSKSIIRVQSIQLRKPNGSGITTSDEHVYTGVQIFTPAASLCGC